MVSLHALDDWLHCLRRGTFNQPFATVLANIQAYYHFTPTGFTNGAQRNEAGQNNGACQCFYFAKLHALTPEQTLLLFSEHYTAVLNSPTDHNHPNIRQFMQHGWSGVQFDGVALTPVRDEPKNFS